MTNQDMENCILSAYIFTSSNNPELNEKDKFHLEVSIFSTPLKKRIAEIINECELYEVEFKCLTMDEMVANTGFEHEFIEILGQSPLTLKIAKLYYDKLVIIKRKEMIL